MVLIWTEIHINALMIEMDGVRVMARAMIDAWKK
jgi:hypothetical protein